MKNNMETTYIYMLICPLDGKVKYVGKANNPQRRVKDHMLDTRDMPPEKAIWVGELKKTKLKPILEILDEIDIDEWKFWESFWMEYFRGLGYALLNRRKGKNGLTYANSQTFKPGNVPWNKNKIKKGTIYV